MIVTEALIAICSGVLIHRTGRYLELIWTGTLLLTLGSGLLIDLNASSTLKEIVPFQVVAGLGSGMLFQAPLIAIQAMVSQDDTATATATFSFVRTIGLALSVVIGGVVFQNGMERRAPKLRAAGMPESVVSQLSGASAAANVMVVASIEDQPQKAVVKEAFAWSLRNMWILYTAVAFLGCVASCFVGKQVLSKEHTETKTGLKKTGQEVS